MRAGVIAPLLIALAAAAPVAAAPRVPPDLAAVAVGIVADGQVIAGGMTLASGPWGTDYITVSHALGVGRKYAMVHTNGAPIAATPVMACSSAIHGMDSLVLRVMSQKNMPVIEWGDPATLRPGDELVVMVRKEFHPEPVKVRFLHANLLEWSRTAGPWSNAWHNVMVAHGMAQPGFSGSPWVRDGKVYGLLKGRVRPPGHTAWYATAETATRVKECL
ncbi:MAG: trypsin-like peptidase domain-containing protein, partial [bacterium]